MKSAKFIVFFLLVAAIFLTAFSPAAAEDPAGVDPGVIAFLQMILLPIAAQVIKVYRDKGGAKPSNAAINWSIFAVGAVTFVLWGDASSFFNIPLPAINWEDPAGVIPALLDFGFSLLSVAGSVLGGAVVWYQVIKKLAFERIPWLMPAAK